MDGHHLILGELTDYISGRTLQDTHDERYRQKVARFLVEKRGYLKSDITPRHPLICIAGENKALTRIDLLVTVDETIGLLVKYGPGSLVTRRRPALAASRLVTGYQIPVAVVTNGEDAEILDAASGSLIGKGLASIPSRQQLKRILNHKPAEPISKKRAEMESRIYYTYEVDGCCPCDDSVCRLP